MVWGLSAGHSKLVGEETEALSSRIVRRRSAAYSFEISRSTGMSFTASGSPSQRARSAKARRRASLTKCTKREEANPIAWTS